MAEPGPQVPGIPATPPPPAQLGLQAPQQLAQPAQQIVHLNWSHFKTEFLENLKKMQKLICFALLTV